MPATYPFVKTALRSFLGTAMLKGHCDLGLGTYGFAHLRMQHTCSYTWRTRLNQTLWFVTVCTSEHNGSSCCDFRPGVPLMPGGKHAVWMHADVLQHIAVPS